MFGDNADNSVCKEAYDWLSKDDGICIKEPCSRKECKEENCVRHPKRHQGENSP